MLDILQPFFILSVKYTCALIERSNDKNRKQQKKVDLSYHLIGKYELIFSTYIHKTQYIKLHFPKKNLKSIAVIEIIIKTNTETMKTTATVENYNVKRKLKK